MQKQQPTTAVAKFNRGQWLRSQTPQTPHGYWDIPIIIQYPTTTTEVDAGPGKHEGETSQDVLNHSKPTLQHPCWCLKFGKPIPKNGALGLRCYGMLQTFLRPLQDLVKVSIFPIVWYGICKKFNLDFVNP